MKTLFSIATRGAFLVCSLAGLWLSIYFLRLFLFSRTQSQDLVMAIAALLVFLGLIVAAGLSFQRRVSILTALVSLAVALAAAEWGLEALGNRPMNQAAPPNEQFQKAAATLGQAPHVYPWVNGAALCESSPPGQDSMHPLASISGSTLLGHYEDGNPAWFSTDQHGFINPTNAWSSAGLQAVLVGDSFTQGFSVETSASYAALLRDRLGPVLNLGQSGTGPLLQYAILKEYTPQLRFKRILWFYFEGNDFLDLKREKSIAWLNRYLASDTFSQDLLSKQGEIDRRLAAYCAGRKMEAAPRAPSRKVRLRDIVRLSSIRGSLGVSFGLLDELRLFDVVLQKTAAYAREHDATFHLVYLPAWERYALRNHPRPRKSEIRFLADRAGARFIDLEAAFARQPDPLRLFHSATNSHYNREGHRLVAQTIIQELESGSGASD